MTHERFLAALHPQDRPLTEATIAQSLAEHTPYALEYRCRWPDGSVHWIAAKGLAYYDRTGTAVRVRGVVLDIDERRRGESEREALVTALELRTREFEQVVYVTSHDLRSPLVNIQGFSQELARSITEIETLLPELDDSPAEGPGCDRFFTRTSPKRSATSARARRGWTLCCAACWSCLAPDVRNRVCCRST
jgi:signal transduction histidine kinase